MSPPHPVLHLAQQGGISHIGPLQPGNWSSGDPSDDRTFPRSPGNWAAGGPGASPAGPGQGHRGAISCAPLLRHTPLGHRPPRDREWHCRGALPLPATFGDAVPSTVPAPARRLWATDLGSPEGVTRPEDARERLTVLWLTCPPWPRLCAGVPPPGAGKIFGWLPSRCAGRSRPAGSYGAASPPRPSRRRGRPPAPAPPPYRPGWAEDQPRQRPRPRPETRQPVGGGGQRPEAGATLHPPGVSSIPEPRARGSGDISGAQELPVRDGPPFPCRPPWGLLPAESNAEQGRPVRNLKSNPSPLGRSLSCSTWRAPDPSRGSSGPVPGPLGPQAPDGRPGPSVAPCAAPELDAVSRRGRPTLPVAPKL
uniref:Basic salivary proline-rich protein 1-like n=1 Tax=Callorhinus ursinus TaxID=34884 RepID=A0A3Q7NNV0_CALUR|nr:basic salivary proline-rich protein 1-like [Callorhinus ursinus]